MTTSTVISHDQLLGQLARLVALSPEADVRINALVRATCGQALSLAPLPAEVEAGLAESDVERLVVEFAEQFSTDVSMITAAQRAQFVSAWGANAFRVAALIFIADFVPRVRAGLEALGAGWPDRPVAWDHTTHPADALFNGFAPTVGALRALDVVTSEIVRRRAAVQHNCRLCKSLREGAALDAGGTETLYGDIERYEASDLLTERHKAALRYVDALIWSPAAITPAVAAGVRSHYSEAETLELTLDVMRNASNKIAVALGGDTPRVEHGTERYLLGDDGQPIFG
jgi:alkylhydroperoxidase family enzyme